MGKTSLNTNLNCDMKMEDLSMTLLYDLFLEKGNILDNACKSRPDVTDLTAIIDHFMTVASHFCQYHNMTMDMHRRFSTLGQGRGAHMTLSSYLPRENVVYDLHPEYNQYLSLLNGLELPLMNEVHETWNTQGNLATMFSVYANCHVASVVSSSVEFPSVKSPSYESGFREDFLV